MGLATISKNLGKKEDYIKVVSALPKFSKYIIYHHIGWSLTENDKLGIYMERENPDYLEHNGFISPSFSVENNYVGFIKYVNRDKRGYTGRYLYASELEEIKSGKFLIGGCNLMTAMTIDLHNQIVMHTKYNIYCAHCQKFLSIDRFV